MEYSSQSESLRNFHKIPQFLNSRYSISQQSPTVSSPTIFYKNIPDSNIHIEVDIYKWRNQTQYPIIQTFYIGKIDNEHNLRTNSYQIMVQTPKFILQKIYKLTMHQILYLLRSIINGIGKLSQKFGYFALTDKMIIINQKNQCKIWVNENFSENRIAWPLPSQKLMIEEILKVIENHSQISRISRKFFISAYKQCTSIPKFHDYLSKFTYDEKILVPPSFQYGLYQKTNRKQHHRVHSNANEFQLRRPQRIKRLSNFDSKEFSQSYFSMNRFANLTKKQSVDKIQAQRKNSHNLFKKSIQDQSLKKRQLQNNNYMSPKLRNLSFPLRNISTSSRKNKKTNSFYPQNHKQSQFHETNFSNKENIKQKNRLCFGEQAEKIKNKNLMEMKFLIKQKMRNKSNLYGLSKKNDCESILESQYYFQNYLAQSNKKQSSDGKSKLQSIIQDVAHSIEDETDYREQF